MNIISKLRTDSKWRKLASYLYSMFGHNSTIIKGKNNNIVTLGTFRQGCKFFVYGNNNKIVFAESAYGIRNVVIRVHGSNNLIQVGKDFASDGLSFSIEDDNNKIIVGENCHGGGHSEFATIEGTNIIIGDDCMFSANITIRTGDSHSIMKATTRVRINKSKSVIIGRHVWIGNTVLIFKGTEIGSYSVVAGGAVVTGRKFPENCIIGGNPATVIKEGIDWCSERI